MTIRLAAIGALALAFTGSALAAYVPHLAVSHPPAGATKIHITQVQTDNATAHIAIFVPTGYTASLAQPVGTQIGTVTALVAATAISPDAKIPLTGTVTIGDQTNSTIATSVTGCTGTPTHAAVWLLTLTAAGSTLNVPVAVDPAAGAAAAVASYVIQTCFSSPATTAFGAKPLDANFQVNGIFTPPAGRLVWDSLFTPYTADNGVPNPPGTAEVRAIAVLPQAATLKAKAAKNRKVSVSGSVTAAGQPVPGATVLVYAGSKKLFTVKTGASGTFAASGKLKKGSYSLQAKASSGDADVTAGGCAPPTNPLAPAGCVSATASGVTASSATVRLKVK